ncbi:HAD-IIIC family phosphatase [Streptomyces sp. HNM0575]|uniref:HAD-IIIC family phosphatase n=1 Tax=Streptomyces sp. HNM0575 TaxID=2716338 RepID=UPI00145CF095|nr:HAD-IIIC family phosphatase [Streptomyces sp. HNM0575]NLU74418.1 HAD-IIIC family phosphatase [Streptomyces sp. HNM0575]
MNQPHEPVKCVVWDLDDTLWDGTLLEGDEVEVPEENAKLVRVLDEHGVLQSVASRNDHDDAMDRLRTLGLDEYFLHPRIGFDAKSASLRELTELLNIGPESVVFVDDSAFERAEVASELPRVRAMTREELHRSVAEGGVLPDRITPEARERRAMYLAEERRRTHEESFKGPAEEFLRSMGMRLTVRRAGPGDLVRAAELTRRTHQLNTTGVTFDEEELSALLHGSGHVVLVCELEDAFGGYGTIGLGVVRTDPGRWTIRLLLMSCRVMGRNIGTAVVAAVAGLAERENAALAAHFRATDRNRQMLVTYRFMGFRTERSSGGLTELVLPDGAAPAPPPYVELTVDVPREG